MANPEGGWDINPPPYSSNLVAAFRLVEMMVSRGYAFSLMQSDTVNNVAFGDLNAIPDYVVREHYDGDLQGGTHCD